MDIKSALLEVHSREQALKIANYVGSDEKRFAELMKLFTGPVYRVSQRAAWPVSLCIERDPKLVGPYFPVLINQIERDDAHIAVRRNVLRLLQFVAIPKRYQGRIFDICYRLFADVSQPVAVRVFAMTVAANLANGDADLMNELQLVAESHPRSATAGFRSRVRRIFGKK